MVAKYRCGYLKIGSGTREPDLSEVVTRLAFIQVAYGVSVKFFAAEIDAEGEWAIPFICAEDPMHGLPNFELAVKQATPYELKSIRVIDLAKVDVETLHLLKSLAPEPAPPVKLSDLRPTKVPLDVVHPEDVFAGLVGMERQKHDLIRIANAVDQHGVDAIGCLHLIFSGNPGTGKTEVAMRMGAYCDLLGITDGTSKFRKVGEADLVAKYVGHTAPKVIQAVESAVGGVLFIDEFYAIANAPHFGREALDALTDQLEAHRDDLVCIIGGYAREVDEALDLNAGLRSRFGFRIDFPDYTDAELADIFVSMARSRGFAVADEDVLAGCVSRLRTTRSFANARTMRNLCDHAIIEAAWKRETPTICAHDLLTATDELFERTCKVGF